MRSIFLVLAVLAVSSLLCLAEESEGLGYDLRLPTPSEDSFFSQQIEIASNQLTGQERCEEVADSDEQGECLLFRALHMLKSETADEAIEDLRLASSLGNSFAMVKLAEVLSWLNKSEVPDETIELYSEAAGMSNPIAQYSLVLIALKYPDKVLKSESELLSLLYKSSRANFVPATKLLGDINRLGLLGISVNHQVALEYYEKAAEYDYPPARHRLALYQFEFGDPDSGFRNLKKSAEADYALAHFDLAERYFAIAGPDYQDQFASKAIHHLQKAYSAGVPGSALKLGMAYIAGRGVEKNLVKAIQFLEEELGQSDGQAEAYLGELYFRGAGTEVNRELACHYFMVSAQAENSDGQFGYGVCLLSRDEVQEGLRLIKMAADRGVARAIHFIETHKESSWFELPDE